MLMDIQADVRQVKEFSVSQKLTLSTMCSDEPINNHVMHCFSDFQPANRILNLGWSNKSHHAGVAEIELYVSIKQPEENRRKKSPSTGF